VSQKYYGDLRTIRTARLRTPYGDKVLLLSAMNGRLLSVGQATAASGYMIPVTFEFDNPDGVVAGSWVEVWLLGALKEGVLSLPTGAVTEQGGLYYVYVQLDEEGYLRREVKLGASDGERVAIVSGLKAGEKVVTRGAVQVRMAAASGAIPHGHSH
jgi:multidrug efflux pump subunit AcrA (membrane-fusion protein)